MLRRSPKRLAGGKGWPGGPPTATGNGHPVTVHPFFPRVLEGRAEEGMMTAARSFSARRLRDAAEKSKILSGLAGFPVSAADPPGLALTPANLSASLREVLRIPTGCGSPWSRRTLHFLSPTGMRSSCGSWFSSPVTKICRGGQNPVDKPGAATYNAAL